MEADADGEACTCTCPMTMPIGEHANGALVRRREDKVEVRLVVDLRLSRFDVAISLRHARVRQVSHATLRDLDAGHESQAAAHVRGGHEPLFAKER